MEAEGAPELVDVLVGRFDRPPARYYELRLERVTAELGADPTALGLYDDAGVACDRLARHDEAIAWMAAKRGALDALPAPDALHEYTYRANLGTFHAHRWLRSGANRSETSDLERARDLLGAAIDLNPEAHFGRERYQVLAIEELLAPTPLPSDVAAGEPVSIVTRILGSQPFIGELEERGYSDAVEGLTGLVSLGDAWESPLVWTSIEHALADREDAFLARLAALRVVELAQAGHPPHPEFDDEAYLDEFRAMITARQLGPIDAWWRSARAAADEWRAARATYAESRLALGEHPDTHPGFWRLWVDAPSRPSMPTTLDYEAKVDRDIFLAGTCLASLLCGAGLVLRWDWVRSRRTRTARSSGA